MKRGQCLCGGVSFDLQGSLKAPTACHCAMCRRWHGALGVYTSTLNTDFHLRGAGLVGWYRSGPNSERGFCRQCGASLFWREVAGSHTDIAMGAIDPPTGLSLACHIWVAHRGDYCDLADGLPQFADSSADAVPIAPVPAPSSAVVQPDLHRGGCLCGAITLSIAGAMRDISTCHCRQCLRWHGHAPAYSKARWSQITLKGADHLHWYVSSETARRGSCDICGSSLLWELLGADAVSISAGALEAPTGLRVRHHIFTAEREDYAPIADRLPQFPGSGGKALPF